MNDNRPTHTPPQESDLIYHELYLDSLAEIGDLRSYLRDTLSLVEKLDAEVEDLRADPMIEAHIGYWGVLSRRRLSEWEQLYQTFGDPFWKAIGAGERAPRPWASALQRYDWKQRQHQPPNRRASSPPQPRFTGGVEF